MLLAPFVFGTISYDNIKPSATNTYSLGTVSERWASLYVVDVNASGNVTGANLNISDWDTAYGWGDHALAGYGDMTKAVYDIVDDGFVDGNDTPYAASWNGNINAPSMNTVYDKIETIGAGAETDPCFALVDNHANWDTAYGWGDHSLAGYLTAYSETDPCHVFWLAGPIINFGAIDIGLNTATPRYINEGREFAAITTGSAVTNLDLGNDVASPADGVGVAGLNYLALGQSAGHTRIGLIGVSTDGTTVNQRGGRMTFYTKPDASTSITERMRIESDGDIVMADDLSATGNITGANLNVSNWDTAFGWGDHSLVGYLTTYSETDPCAMPYLDQSVKIAASPTFAALTVDSPTLCVNLPGYTDQVGIGTATPSQALDLIGSLELEDTTTSTIGVIYKGANRFLHNFHHPTGGGAVPVGYNTFVGEESGNFAMGSTATSTYHASYNAGFGYRALFANTNGYYNLAMGGNSLRANTIGSNNLAIAYNAMRLNTTGFGNLGMGASALYFNQTGNENTVAGSLAGYGVTGNSFSYNSLFGAYSGYSLSTGLSNLFLGYKSGYNQTTNSNLLIIDNQDRSSAANEITNALIYGVFNATAASQTLNLNAAVLARYGVSFADADTSPDAAGELLYDNTVTGLLDGAMCWYDDDAVRYIVDLATLPVDDDYVVAYDAAADGFYMKADADAAETDPCHVLHLSTYDHNDIATAFGWGDHSLAGYLTKAIYDVLDDAFVDANDTAYAASWDGNINAVSMNAAYDKMQTLVPYSGATGNVDLGAYDLTATNLYVDGLYTDTLFGSYDTTFLIIAYSGDGASPNGSPIDVVAGGGYLTGNGGAAYLEAGNSGATSGNGGAVTIYGGDAKGSSGNGGDVIFRAGYAAGTDANGTYKFENPLTHVTPKYGILDFSLITTSNKTFTFPNTSGTLLTTVDISANTNLTAGDHITLTDDDLDVDDDFLLNTGDSGTGVYDFGGATSVEIPNGTNPTVDATGEMAWETDDADLHVYDGALDVVIASKTQSRFHVIPSPVVGSDFPFWETPRAITITKVAAICTGGTNVVGQLQEYDPNGTGGVDVDAADWTITTTELEDTSFTNATIDAGDWVGWKTTSVSGTVKYFSITFEYYEQ